MKTEIYDISGMHCAACSGAVQRVVSRLSGVSECEVNLMTEKMTVKYDEKAVSFEDFKWVIEKAGFGISEAKEEKETAPAVRRHFRGLSYRRYETAVLIFVEMWKMAN